MIEELKKIKLFFEMYYQFQRRTGRTTRMIENLKDGDIVVFSDYREAKRVESVCNKKILTIICQPSIQYLESELRGIRTSRIIFDHSWLESFFRNHFNTIANDLMQIINVHTKK